MVSIETHHDIPQGARVVVIADKETPHSNTIANGLSTKKKIVYDKKLTPNSKEQLKFDQESKDCLLALYVAPNGSLGQGTLFRPCDTYNLSIVPDKNFGVIISTHTCEYGILYTAFYLEKKYRKADHMWSELYRQMDPQELHALRVRTWQGIAKAIQQNNQARCASADTRSEGASK